MAFQLSRKEEQGTAQKPLKRRGVSYSKWGYFFIAPFFIIYAIFQVYPLCYTFFLSFNELHYDEFAMRVGPNFIGLDNFKEIFVNAGLRERVLGAFGNTFIMWIVNFVPQIVLALLLASWFTNTQLRIKGQGFWKTILYMPNIITAASIAVLFCSLFTYPNATVNNLLVGMGILKEPYNFFRSATATRLIVSFINFWMWYGNTMVVLMGAMMGINPAIFESAAIDGAKDSTVFFRITLPLIRPVMLYTLVTSLIGGLQMFDVPQLFQGGGPNYKTETITMLIFNQAFAGNRNSGRSAAFSMMLLVVTAVLSALVFFMLRDKDAAQEKKMRKQRLRELKNSAGRA